MKPLQELDLARVVDVVRGDARDHGLRRPAPEARSEGGLGEILRRPRGAFRCSLSRRSFAAATSFAVDRGGDGKKFEPSSANDPRFSPVSRRRTVYFQ